MKIIIFILLFLSLLTIDLMGEDYNLKSLNGKDIRFSDNIGKKVVLLNFWASWCTPCKSELPILEQIYKKYKKRGFTIISVSMDEISEQEDVKSIVHTLDLSFPVVIDSNGAIADFYNRSKNAPFTILFDKNGEIVRKYLGFHSGDKVKLETKINQLLNEKKLKDKKNYQYQLSTNGIYTLYNKDDNNPLFSNYEIFQTRTELLGAYENFSIFTTLHSNHFLTTTPYIRDQYDDDKQKDIRVEKFGASYSWNFLKIKAGDLHIVQGSGLALSFNKIDDLGVDTTIQGGELDFSLRYLKLKVFGGRVNNTNHNFLTNEIYEDKNDILVGTKIKIVPDKKFNIEFYFNYILFSDPNYFNDIFKKPENFENQGLSIVGTSLSLDKILNKFNFYGEINFGIHKFYDQDGIDNGIYSDEIENLLDDSYSLYYALSFNYKKISIVQEFKRYKNFIFGFQTDIAANNRKSEDNIVNTIPISGSDIIFYNNPKTLEREREKVEDIATDVWGSKISFKYKLNKNIKPYLNYLYSYSYYKKIDTHHIYGGSTIYFNNLKSKIDIAFNFRTEDHNSEKSPIDYSYYGIDFDISLFIKNWLSFDIKSYFYLTKHSGELIGEKNKQDGELNLGIILFSDIFLSYIYTRYTFREVGSEKDNYHAFELKYKFFTDSFVKLFYGEIRGGVKCLGGVCKEYPPFNGLKAEFLFSF